MRRAGDEVERAVAQRFHRLRHGKEQLDFLDVQSFSLEETKLDGGDGGKIGIRDQVGDGDAHQ